MDTTNLIGERFGRWTVIGFAENTSKTSRGRRWFCRCDCGTERVVKAQSLLSGKSKSCGCLHSDVMKSVGKQYNTKHGMTNTRLYRIHRHIINRCTNPNDIRYNNYGGRGITMCNEWFDFETFAKWALDNGYNDNVSIDRIDVNGNYCPENCRWASNLEQANNRTSNKMYTFNGETHNIKQWSEIYNIPYKKLWKRLYRGWDISRALTT